MAEEKITLFDSNIISPQQLLHDIYPVRSYKKLNIDDIMAVTNIISRVMGQIHAEELMTINDVALELADFQRAISNKTRFLNHRKKGKQYEAEIHMGLLNEVVNSLVKKAKSSLYKPLQKDCYAQLENLVIKLDDAFDIRKRQGKPQHRNTDDRLAAMLFYVPLFENKKAQIITNDQDMVKLSSTLFYTLTYALDDDYCKMAMKKLSKYRPFITGNRSRDEHHFPSADGSYTVLDWFNKINDRMKEDAKKIIRVSYGIKG
jgi:hypothetical protein